MTYSTSGLATTIFATIKDDSSTLPPFALSKDLDPLAITSLDDKELEYGYDQAIVTKNSTRRARRDLFVASDNMVAWSQDGSAFRDHPGISKNVAILIDLCTKAFVRDAFDFGDEESGWAKSSGYRIHQWDVTDKYVVSDNYGPIERYWRGLGWENATFTNVGWKPNDTGTRPVLHAYSLTWNNFQAGTPVQNNVDMTTYQPLRGNQPANVTRIGLLCMQNYWLVVDIPKVPGIEYLVICDIGAWGGAFGDNRDRPTGYINRTKMTMKALSVRCDSQWRELIKDETPTFYREDLPYPNVQPMRAGAYVNIPALPAGGSLPADLMTEGSGVAVEGGLASLGIRFGRPIVLGIPEGITALRLEGAVSWEANTDYSSAYRLVVAKKISSVDWRTSEAASLASRADVEGVIVTPEDVEEISLSKVRTYLLNTPLSLNGAHVTKLENYQKLIDNDLNLYTETFQEADPSRGAPHLTFRQAEDRCQGKSLLVWHNLLSKSDSASPAIVKFTGTQSVYSVQVTGDVLYNIPATESDLIDSVMLGKILGALTEQAVLIVDFAVTGDSYVFVGNALGVSADSIRPGNSDTLKEVNQMNESYLADLRHDFRDLGLSNVSALKLTQGVNNRAQMGQYPLSQITFARVVSRKLNIHGW